MLSSCLRFKRMLGGKRGASKVPIQDAAPADIPSYGAADLKKISFETLRMLTEEQVFAFTDAQIQSMPKQVRMAFLAIIDAFKRAEAKVAKAEANVAKAEANVAKAEANVAKAEATVTEEREARMRAEARADRLQGELDNEKTRVADWFEKMTRVRPELTSGSRESQAMKAVLQTLLSKELEQLEGLKASTVNETVLTLISGRPILETRISPWWGQTDYPVPTTTRSTTASPIWLEFLENDVADWNEAAFVTYLESAPQELLDKLLNAEVNGSLASRFNGKYLSDLVKESNGKEAVVEYLLQRGVWQALQDLCDLDGIKNDLTCGVRSGEASGTIVIPPQFRGLLKPDRVIEVQNKRRAPVSKFDNGWANSTADNVDDWGEQAKIPVEYTNGGFGATAMEIKPPHLNPVYHSKFPEDFVNPFKGCGPSFVSVLQYRGRPTTSSALRDSIKNYNPVSQVGTYAAAYRLSKVAICDLNTIAYGKLVTMSSTSTSPPDVDSQDEPGSPTKHFMFISKRFDWASSAPPLESRPWSHWEILIRWMLASLGNSMLNKMPDTLKKVAKVAADRKTPKKRSKETSSATGSVQDDGNETEGTQNSKKKMEQADEECGFDQLYWEELWDPIRFAIPATHSIEMETTQERLPGDALLLAHQRTGPTYRKVIRGVDAVVKVALRYDPDRDDEIDYYELVQELEREATAYERLKELQGRYIPKFLWHGEIMPNAAVVVATEYAGQPLPAQQSSSAVMARSALKALSAIHTGGVAHGDVRLANLLVKDSSQQVCIIDFGRCKFQSELPPDEWASLIAEERATLESLLGMEEAPKEHVLRGSSRKRRMSHDVGS